MNPVDVYVKNSVQTSSPLQQIILLYDRAILALKSAAEDMENGNIQGKIENITKAQDIVRALDSALDFEKGEEIAQNLHELYQFVDSSLFHVHVRNDKDLLNDLVDILQTLKEGWEGIQSKI